MTEQNDQGSIDPPTESYQPVGGTPPAQGASVYSTSQPSAPPQALQPPEPPQPSQPPAPSQPQSMNVPVQPVAGVSYGRPNTYSPPYESRQPWSGQTWQPQTPQHWLEPLPGQDRRRRQSGGRGGLYLVLVIIVALLAGAAGSAA